MHFSQEAENPTTPAVVQAPEARPEVIEEVVVGIAPPGLKRSLRAKDNSDLHLIPPIELELKNKNVLGSSHIALKAFYLSESPITNQQYVAILKANLDRIQIDESDVNLDGRLVLMLSEKIRGYKPIVFSQDFPSQLRRYATVPSGRRYHPVPQSKPARRRKS